LVVYVEFHNVTLGTSLHFLHHARICLSAKCAKAKNLIGSDVDIFSKEIRSLKQVFTLVARTLIVYGNCGFNLVMVVRFVVVFCTRNITALRNQLLE